MPANLRLLLLTTIMALPLWGCAEGDKAETGGKTAETGAKKSPEAEAIAQAAALTREGKAEEALALLDKLPEKSRKTSPVMNARGVTLDNLARHKEAQATYTEALMISPNAPMLRNNLALSYIFSGKYDEAVKLLQPLASGPQSSPKIRQNLALAYGMKGEKERALALLKRDMSEDKAQANLAFYDKYRGRKITNTESFMAAPVESVSATVDEKPAEKAEKPVAKKESKPVVIAEPEAEVVKPEAPTRTELRTAASKEAEEKKAEEPKPALAPKAPVKKAEEKKPEEKKPEPKPEVKKEEPKPAPKPEAKKEEPKDAPKPEVKKEEPKPSKREISEEEENSTPLPDDGDVITGGTPLDGMVIERSYPTK